MTDGPRPIRRIVLGVLGVILVVVIGGAIALRAALTPERLRTETIRLTTDATGLETQLDSASLSLWPLAIEIQGLRIAGDTAEDPPFLALDSARLRVRLRPLLSRNVVIARIELDAPVLSLQKQGTVVVLPGKLGAPPPPDTKAPGGDVAAPAARGVAAHFRGAIERFEIHNGSIRVRTPGGTEDVDLSGVHLAARIEISTGADEIQSNGELRLDDLSLAALAPYRETLDTLHPTVDFDVAFRPRDGHLMLRTLRLVAAPLELALTGDVTGLPEAPFLSLTLEPRTLSLEELLPLIPPAAFPEGRVPTASGPVTVSGSVKGALGNPESPPDVHAEIRFDGARLALAGFDSALDNVRGTVVATATAVELRDLSVSLGPDALTLSGRIDGTDHPETARFDLHVAGSADLGVLQRSGFTPEGTTISGRLDLDAGAQGSAAEPDAASLSGQVTLADVAWTAPDLPVPITGVAARADLNGANATIVSFSGRAGTSPFEGKGRIERVLSKEPHAFLEGRSSRFDLREWVPAVPAPGAPGDGKPAGATVAPPAPPLLPPLPPIRADLRLVADSLYTVEAALAGVSLVVALVDGRAGISGTVASGDFGPGVHMKKLTSQVNMVGQTLKGTFRSERVDAHRIPLTDVQGQLDLGADRRLKVSDVTAAVWTGRVEGSAVVDLADPAAPAFQVETRAKNLQANDFVSGLTPARDFLFGTMDITSSFSGRGLTPQAVAASLVGNGQVNTREGRLNQGPQTRAIWNTLQLGNREAIPFRDMITAFSVQDGRLVTKDLAIASTDAVWKANGAVAFDGTLDYAVEVELSEALSDRFRTSVGPDVAQLLEGTSGRIVLNLAIDGRVEAPRVALDRKRLAERASEKAAENVKKEIERGKGKLGDALKNLLGGK